MIQALKQLRSGWAVFAAGALVASVLAAGAAPAGAVTDRADHATRLSACVGDAAADRMFTDVSAGHVFRNAINCIAYYGITQGTGDGSTYSPEQDVTRAQMAVFIARAAEVASVDLGPVPWTLASTTSVTPGRRGPGRHQPARIEGDHPLGRRLPARRRRHPGRDGDVPDRAAGRGRARRDEGLQRHDPSGRGGLEVGGRRPVPRHGRSCDSRDLRAGRDPGRQRGRGAGPTMPPLDFNYEPDGTVNRGQMAAFITRALAHTPVRPAGVTAQFDGADVIVSVRNAQYRPVSRAVVDVFWATADQGTEPSRPTAPAASR